MSFSGRTAGTICFVLATTGCLSKAAELRLEKALLPAAMQGLWAYEPGDCGNPDSDGLMAVARRSVDFYASAYHLSRVARRADGSIRAFGLRSDQGEEGRTPDDLTLKLLAPDRLRVVTNSPDGHIYHRCKDRLR
jgi:hypothetical protein